MNKYLLDFYAKYPVSTAQDYLKLLFQAEYGCEHIMGSYVLDYINSELPDSNNADTQLVEPISDEYCRVHLSEFKRKGYFGEVLAKCMLMVKSSGNNDQLNAQIDNFLQLVDSGAINLNSNDAHSLVEKYRELGCPPVHHSEVFRNAYQPHYRVIYRKHAILLSLLCKIYQLLQQKQADADAEASANDNKTPVCNPTKPIIVAIDGCCGSGKSTYAQVLAQFFDNATVIHADDFFLPLDMRTSARLNEIGGNIHYERLVVVLKQAQQGQQFAYDAYDCSTNSYVKRNFAPTPVIIVEGSYALRQELRPYYDVKALVWVDEQTQYQRLLRREGADGVINFVNKWIPLENRYFRCLDTNDCIVIDSEDE